MSANCAGKRAKNSKSRTGGYPPNYYAAFVKDPDGHNIEAVHRG